MDWLWAQAAADECECRCCAEAVVRIDRGQRNWDQACTCGDDKKITLCDCLFCIRSTLRSEV